MRPLPPEGLLWPRSALTSMLGDSLFMTSLCTKYWQTFLSQAVGQGIFMGFLYMPSISVLAHYFERRRSLVMGIAMAGSSVGGIVFPSEFLQPPAVVSS